MKLLSHALAVCLLTLFFSSDSHAAQGNYCPNAPNRRCNTCPCGPELGNPPGGDGPTFAADPVGLADGNTFLSNADVSLATSLGSLTINRMYNSNDQSWAPDARYPVTYVPRPFGASPTNSDSLRWWHSWFSFVSKPTLASGRVEIRDFAGGLLELRACASGVSSCWLPSGYATSGPDDRVWWDGTQYTYYMNTGYQYVYGAALTHPAVTTSTGSDTTTTRYFISQVRNANGVTLATVTYAPPPFPNCPGNPGANGGVPYIDRITSPDGSYIQFSYALLTLPSPECVIDHISVRNRQTGTDETIASYSYQNNKPGLLSTVTLPGKVITYTNSASQFSASVGSRDVVHHWYSPTSGAVTDSVAGYENVSISSLSAGAALPGALCSPNVNQVTVTDKNATAGNGSTLPVQLLTTYRQQQNLSVHEPRFYYSTQSVNGGTSGAALGYQPAQEELEQNCSDITITGSLRGTREKNGAWTAFENADAGVYMPERRKTFVGATAASGTGALETTEHTYRYGVDSVQLKEENVRPSLLGGGTAREIRIYDLPTSNRLKGIIKVGTTKTRSAPGTWTNTSTPRMVGTFYLAEAKCTGGAPDPLKRTLEVQGPCEVLSTSATQCPEGTSYPLTQYAYYPAGANNQAGRLQSITRRASAPGTDACAGTALTTTYGGYDALGNPTSVTDPNGVTTTYTYSGNQVTSSTTNGATTTVGYENGEQIWVKYPQNNYEVICHRSGTTTADCSGGTWNSKPQWKAKSSTTSGATWSEKVVYTYWPNGSLASETYLGPCSSGCTPSSGEVRRVVKHAVNVLRQRTLVELGDAASPAVRSPRQYSASGQLVAIGPSYNAAPDFCGTIGAPSQLCSSMAYDRADRLIGLDQWSGTTDLDSRTCLGYDAQGNVSSVQMGCSPSATGGDCGGCTRPVSFYQYDDFGNLVEATLPWTDNGAGGSGTTRYQYDAAGNILVKESPTMAASASYLAYEYDSLGRVLTAKSYYTTPSPGFYTLFTLAYDNSGSGTPADCSPSATPNTMGRVRRRTDSFGSTYYQYDAWGRLTDEIRPRLGFCAGASINDTPHTRYTYSANGNLSTVTYPFGRTVTYGYGTGALTDRASSVSVALWNGGSPVVTQIISSVAWEPYGGLRAYQINHPSSATASGVEYWLGNDTSNLPGNQCGVTSVASDHTGRLRSIIVNGGSLSLGNTTASLYQRTYAWTGEQVVQTRTCVMGTPSPVLRELYGYDRMQRLTSYAPNPGQAESFSYSSRWNRKTNADYGSTNFPDWQTGIPCTGVGCLASSSFAYDRDGRVTTHTRPNDSSGTASSTVSYSPAPSSGGGLDTVLRSVTVAGANYQYFYDAMNRRRLKEYPSTARDEYFYDSSNNLLVDRGNDSVVTPTYYVTDEYVWLGGRPVAFVRGRLSTAWVRASDFTATCSRAGDGSACGVYFPITDHIGKPVVILDSSRRIAQLMDHQPFGHVNRVSAPAESAHPYAHSSNVTLATYAQTVPTSFSVRYRVNVHLLDTEAASGASVQDFLELQDAGNSAVLATAIGGHHRGALSTPWVTPTTTSGVRAVLKSNTTNCCPSGTTTNCGCAAFPNFAYSGVVLAGYEYQRYQSTATPISTPLRFPGQYFDAETGLFENWNRYYEPMTGRYLQPEPLAATAEWSLVESRRGVILPSYAYAHNNPIANDDPTGLLSGLPISPPISGPVVGPGFYTPIDLPILEFPWEPSSPEPGPALEPFPAPAPSPSPSRDEPLPPDETPACPNDPPHYICVAKCNIQQIGTRDTSKTSGSSTKNCALATVAAKANTPRGWYPRHCRCDDSDGFHGKGTSCEKHRR